MNISRTPLYQWAHTILFPQENFSDGAMFDPSTMDDVYSMVELLDIHPGARCVDLGSGDGRVVLEMARRGGVAYGIERDLALVHENKRRVHQAGLTHTAHILQQNFWDVPLTSFEKIAVFQYHTVMGRLEEKLQRELPAGAHVVSHHWQFPIWDYARQVEDIYLYIKQ